VLREHYAAGRLSLDELRRRVGIVLATGYADEAVAVIADLPPGGRQLDFRGPQATARRTSGGSCGAVMDLA
jgi:hypothetical protein